MFITVEENLLLPNMEETAQERSYNVRTPNRDDSADVPLISLAGVSDPRRRSILIEEIASACQYNGVFQVTDHGIPGEILQGALSAASGFFNLSAQDKAKFMSNDVYKPVRYGTSIKDGLDSVPFWRVFLKHYSHPLSHWIGSWPNTPPDYRDKMGKHVQAIQKLAVVITGLITESLGLGPTYLTAKMDAGMQVMAVNSYPACPLPVTPIGLPPHSDYGCLTVVLQGSPGLQILDPGDKSWRMVPFIDNALQVHVGDQLEVLSNGRYKSIVHRVVVDRDRTRISVAGLHCLGMDEKMATTAEMVEDGHRSGYRESCFRDFLDFIARNDLSEGRCFLDTLRIPE